MNVALPKSTETPRTRELQAIASATFEKELEAWPLATNTDYAVFGQYITLFSYIDLNLRWIVEAAAAAGILQENKTKACHLKIDKVEISAAVSASWNRLGLTGRPSTSLICG